MATSVFIKILSDLPHGFFHNFSIANILIIIYFPIADLALKMVRDRNDLAFAHNDNEETALHLLDQYRPEHDPTSPIMTNRPSNSFN